VHAVANHPFQDRRLPDIWLERENRGDVIFQGCRLLGLDTGQELNCDEGDYVFSMKATRTAPAAANTSSGAFSID
jgi:hypothetical protein